MNRTELIIATAIILFAAFMLGWFAHWLVNRFLRVAQSDMNELDKMAQQLHDAEEQRDQAVSYYQQREEKITNQQSQTDAELRAAMDGLQAARLEIDELRTYVDKLGDEKQS
ncbi:MAG: hypothetical protein V3U96_02145 [Paracoccaceae bacterium]